MYLNKNLQPEQFFLHSVIHKKNLDHVIVSQTTLNRMQKQKKMQCCQIIKITLQLVNFRIQNLPNQHFSAQISPIKSIKIHFRNFSHKKDAGHVGCIAIHRV